MKNLILVFFLLAWVTGFAQEHERWDVKTLTDGFSPDISSAKRITVAKIESIRKVPVRNNQPRLNMEKQVVTITGTIRRVQLESDGDYHIEVGDGSMQDSTFVCEAVDPTNLVAATSGNLTYFTAVRSVASTLHVGDKVTFSGVIFQDKYHSPSPYRTRNFVEMHPILRAIKN